MELLQYCILLLLIIIAPPIGMLMTRIAPDERKAGERWFVVLRYMLIFGFGLLVLWANRAAPWTASLAVAGVLLFLAARNFPLIEHALVGVAFWFSTIQPVSAIAVLILFLLGMVGGTLATEPKALAKKSFWTAQLRGFSRTVWPILIALPLYLL